MRWAYPLTLPDPVTAGSNGVAAAVTQRVPCPGPPARTIPVPLPNIGKSGDSPKDLKEVIIEGKKVAIKGASFKSIGDMASKGTGGGLVSANTHEDRPSFGSGVDGRQDRG